MSNPFTKEELEVIRNDVAAVRIMENYAQTKDKETLRDNILRKIKYQLETKTNEETKKPNRPNPLSWMDKE